MGGAPLTQTLYLEVKKYPSTRHELNMIYSDLLRQILISATGLTFVIFALWSIFQPASLAKLLGYQLTPPNGNSEFGAIYTGVFLGQAALCVLAACRIHDQSLGDLVAIFLLLQPVGRILPWLQHGAPQGVLRLLLITELLGGFLILIVRPIA